MTVDGRADIYRLNAEPCLQLARSFSDRECRLIMLGMANAWLTLAEQHLKNSGTVLVYETPPNEPPNPRPVDEPPTPPPIDEPSKPPVNNPPPAKEPPPMHLRQAGKPDNSIVS
jgi:hypothetical protein